MKRKSNQNQTKILVNESQNHSKSIQNPSKWKPEQAKSSQIKPNPSEIHSKSIQILRKASQTQAKPAKPSQPRQVCSDLLPYRGAVGNPREKGAIPRLLKKMPRNSLGTSLAKDSWLLSIRMTGSIGKVLGSHWELLGSYLEKLQKLQKLQKF